MSGVVDVTMGRAFVGIEADADRLTFISVTVYDDDRFTTPPLIAGREVDDHAADEVVISDGVARSLDIGLDDIVSWQGMTHDEFVAFGKEGFDDLSGARVDLKVVGITRDPADFVIGEAPLVQAGPAFLDRYGHDLQRSALIELRLDDAVDLPAFNREVLAATRRSTRLPPDGQLAEPEIYVLRDIRPAIDDAERVLAWGLVVFTVVASVAGATAVAQASSRHLLGSAADRGTLEALGMSRAQRTLVLACPGAIPAAVGAFLAPAGAVIASGLTPLGIARRAEPDPGLAVDAWVMAVGAAAVAALVVGAFTLAALVADRRTMAASDGRVAGRRVRPSFAGVRPRPATTVAHAWLFEHSHRRRKLPTRSALAGIATGVAGATAAIIFTASSDRLAADPSRWGTTADLTFEVVSGPQRRAAQLRLDATQEVESFAFVQQSTVQIGDELVTAYGVEPSHAPLVGTLLSGRPARSPREVVLGPALLDRLDRRVGDQVAVNVDDRSVPLLIVGSALGPASSSSPFDGEVWVTPGVLTEVQTNAGWLSAFVDLAPTAGTEVQQVLAGDLEVIATFRPDAISNLVALGALPPLLALLFAGLGVVAHSHAVVLTVRRRDRELAILRSIGFTSGQVRRTTFTMAAALALGGTAIGLPIGVWVGTRSWNTVADAIHVVPVVTMPLSLLAVIPLALVGALVVAVVPALRAARRDLTDALRSE